MLTSKQRAIMRRKMVNLPSMLVLKKWKEV